MREIREVRKLVVRHNDKVVGYLAENAGEIAFQYDEAWLKDGFSISPLSLPLTKGVFVSKKDTFDGLYGVFDYSLPDGWGALMMIRKLADEGINYERLSPLTKLSLVGANGKGSLSYEPTQGEKASALSDLDEIAGYAKEILENKRVEEKNLDSLYGLMGSSGGARPKAYIAMDGEEWIVKFHGQFDSKDCGKEEYLSNELARKCGLQVNEYRLFDSRKCSGYFGALRFDRAEGKRIHMISLSSLLETSFRLPNLDYMHLLKVVKSISIDQEDLYEAYGRMCFNVIYGNKDDHGNNFSFLYDEKAKGYRLSPFYDITKTTNMGEHTMSVLGNGNPSEDDLLRVGKEMSLNDSRCLDILRRVKSVIGK